MQENFNQIYDRYEFDAFKEIFANTKGSGMNTLKSQEFFILTFEKLAGSFQDSLENTIKQLETKIDELKNINFKNISK